MLAYQTHEIMFSLLVFLWIAANTFIFRAEKSSQYWYFSIDLISIAAKDNIFICFNQS